MRTPAIAYNLPDAVVVTTTWEHANRLLIDIARYPRYYPGEPTVRLVLSGISNAKEVAAFHREVTALAHKQGRLGGRKGRLGYRIDEFKYAADTAGKDAQMSVYLAVDHLPPLIIRCKKHRFVQYLA